MYDLVDEIVSNCCVHRVHTAHLRVSLKRILICTFGLLHLGLSDLTTAPSHYHLASMQGHTCPCWNMNACSDSHYITLSMRAGVQSEALFEEMRGIMQRITPDVILFVMDATTGQSAGDQARAFRECVDVGGVIITKMDGAAKGGATLSAVAATSSPVQFIGTGVLLLRLPSEFT